MTWTMTWQSPGTHWATVAIDPPVVPVSGDSEAARKYWKRVDQRLRLDHGVPDDAVTIVRGE